MACAPQGGVARARQRLRFDDRPAHDRPAGEPWRHGEHAEHHLAHHRGPCVRWRRREGRRSGKVDRSGDRGGEVRRCAGWFSRRIHPRDQCRHCRSVYCDRSAWTDVQDRVRPARAGTRGAVANHKCVCNANLGADPLEQLRCLHGGNSWGVFVHLSALRCVQYRQSTYSDCDGGSRLAHAHRLGILRAASRWRAFVKSGVAGFVSQPVPGAAS
jgi:hypothetical protein